MHILYIYYTIIHLYMYYICTNLGFYGITPQ